MSLQGKTLFITGASRGIGLAIALRAARDGANVVIAAKTTAPHAKLEGTIYSAEGAVVQGGEDDRRGRLADAGALRQRLGERRDLLVVDELADEGMEDGAVQNGRSWYSYGRVGHRLHRRACCSRCRR